MRKRCIAILPVAGLLLAFVAVRAADEPPAIPNFGDLNKPVAPATQPAGPVEPGVILDTASFWRIRTVWETPEMVQADGKIGHVNYVWQRNAHLWFKENPNQPQLPTTQYSMEDAPLVRLPAETPADWMKPAFDDSDWARLRAPVLKDSISHEWKLILMRGMFEVADPAKATGLKLSLAFRGGAVVYLNGEELTRASMPPGPLGLYTPAEPYGDDAHFDDEGYAANRKDKVFIERRTRRVTEVAVPTVKLRKGVNVLAVAVHRSPTTYKTATRRIRPYALPAWTRTEEVTWSELALMSIRLAGPPTPAVVPNVALLTGRGFKVWNQSVTQKVFIAEYPDPFSPLEPIQLSGVRNGTFAGQVVVGDDQPIKGLNAVASDLKGPGVIPGSAVRVRYALSDGLTGGGYPPSDKDGWFDSLNDEPPAEVPVYPSHGGALQPVWVEVRVPGDAKAGDYAGSIAISAQGVKPVTLPLKLRVVDWSLPPVDAFVTTMDVIQSPESVSMAYDVALWSDEHFKLLDRTFSVLGPLGAKTLYVTAIRRTHFGNEHAMVRWVRGEDEELTADFSIVEKYLDVALKHVAKPRGVILYCWEPPESQGHAGSRPWDKPVLLTVVDPKTGKMSAIEGPALGTPESKAFWKKLTDGFRTVLRKRGLENALLFGLIGDSRPTKVAMDDMANGMDGDDHWALHSHLFADKWQGHDIRFVNALWGIGVQPADPSRGGAAGYAFGWSNPLWLSYYPREMHISSTLVEHRTKLETWMGARRGYTPLIAPGTGARGLGRLGGDFWKVLKDRRGRVIGTLAGRYPEAAWGQLDLNFCVSYLIGRGPKGALPTVRSEAMRLGLQEVEARVYVEKAWLDPESKTLLGDELMARIRSALDDRIRMCINARGEGESWFISSGWNERTETLFGLAAEISRKFAGREPQPNLAPRPGLDKPPIDPKKRP